MPMVNQLMHMLKAVVWSRNLVAQCSSERDDPVEYPSKYFIAPFLSVGIIQVIHPLRSQITHHLSGGRG